MYEHNRFAKQAQEVQEDKIQIQDNIRVLNHQLANLDGLLAVQERLQQGRLDKGRWVRGAVKARAEWVAGSSLLAVEPEQDLEEATRREAQELTRAVADIWTPASCGVRNDEGARMTTARGDQRYFCGRWFDRFARAGKGQCGPDDGQHQCASCKRYETANGQAENQLVSWSWRPVVDSDAEPLQAAQHSHPSGCLRRPAGVAVLTRSAPAAVPCPTSAVAWISTHIKTAMRERMAACASLAHSHPQQLVGQRVLLLQRDATNIRGLQRLHGYRFGSMSHALHIAAVIRGYSADLGLHIVRPDRAVQPQGIDAEDANGMYSHNIHM